MQNRSVLLLVLGNHWGIRDRRRGLVSGLARCSFDDTVDEAFPFTLPDANTLAAMPADDMKALETEFMAALPPADVIDGLSADDRQAVEDRVMAAAEAVMVDKPMNDAMPSAETEWVLVSEGQFRDADAAHRGSGRAAIFEQGEQRVLRLEDFEVTNGPDLHVLLVANPNPTSSADMGDYIDLGSLKGNIGNQNYEIPSDVDLSLYQSVMIYCVPFHVVFSVATLN